LSVRRLGIALALLLSGAVAALAQTRGAVQVKQQPPTYPEDLWKSQQQGNVLLIGRIDSQGRVQDVVVVGASQTEFEIPAMQAVRAWEFKPATRDGKPIEIFLNASVRFRIPGDRRGDIPFPMLGDLAISPADASGKATAPEGFPLRLGKDPALRAEAVLDVAPNPAARTLAVRVEARAPSGKTYPVFQPPVLVPARATEVRVPIVVKIGDGWEEGVWGLLFTVEGKGAGGGQFWLARDPTRFAFVPKA
jgi:TonB family protein